ncbi:Hypothetical predicted protein [Mytilus galloprovincialis]|uniref:Reverse transcriptase domain-containing protein n=1 Tax=Mytilus galloprovincialis TaxID=29158 RepID=A0A8B6HIB1_MYTGA|nr:Hypothetical predicted protein [Mytilus galloprovincialis]
MGKVFETIHLSKISPDLDRLQNKLQRGFTKRVSPTNAALLLTEALADAKDRKKKVFVAFIDASKAFDVVWHDSLMLKLFQSGVKDEDCRRNEKCVDEFYLHRKTIEHVVSYTHVGINRNSAEKCLVSERIKLARRTCYSLMGAGMRGYNGVNPNIVIKLWNTYVRPRLIFGLDCVTLTRKELDELNFFTNHNLKFCKTARTNR